MSFEEIPGLKREYRSLHQNIVKEFYVPVLKQSVIYKRAVGYFSTSALVKLTEGLSTFIKNNGKMKLIVSPVLNKDDVKEIEKGYSIKKLIEEKLISEIDEPNGDIEQERLSWIAYMIANGNLEIKVAYLDLKRDGIYHEKVGIFYDIQGNSIAFSGSLNETYNAFYNNYESFDVYLSWKLGDKDRVSDKIIAFDNLWNNNVDSMKILEFPEAARKKLLKYEKKDKLNFSIDDVLIEKNFIPENEPCVPSSIEFYDYQKEAIQSWESNNYRGIFDMATGTGKTLTSLGALTNLFANKKKIAAIIVCPYQHLVEQWVEDIEKFNIKPIIAYSKSKQKDWKNRLKDEIIDYNLGITKFMCLVITNSSFNSEFVQNEILKIAKGKTLVVDEAHNFGATKTLKTLNESYEYRLALSATIERHSDEEGTNSLYAFFGKKCIEYNIERAIEEEKLTPYYYYPIIVKLDQDEYDKYIEISKKISKVYIAEKKKNTSESEYLKMLLIKRARIVAGARNKINKLKDILEGYVNDSHILVYCGATKVSNEEYETDEFDLRQIEEVSRMIGNELNMINTHFTSNEDQREREIIKEKFEKNDPYQVLVAIKCLDEGVNIPSIKTAFILASSTNPKEYIQRRGRVLRKLPDKNFATIYDFVTLPYLPSEAFNIVPDDKKYDISLVKKEMRRIEEFGRIALNPYKSDELLDEMKRAYNLDLFEEDVKNGEL